MKYKVPKAHYGQRWLFWGKGFAPLPGHLFLRDKFGRDVWAYFNEVDHCLYWQKVGWLRGILLYIKYHIKFGYDENPLEESSRLFANACMKGYIKSGISAEQYVQKVVEELNKT